MAGNKMTLVKEVLMRVVPALLDVGFTVWFAPWALGPSTPVRLVPPSDDIDNYLRHIFDTMTPYGRTDLVTRRATNRKKEKKEKKKSNDLRRHFCFAATFAWHCFDFFFLFLPVWLVLPGLRVGADQSGQRGWPRVSSDGWRAQLHLATCTTMRAR